VGLYLDPWQKWTTYHSLGYKPDSTYSAFEVGLIVSRQNGKGEILIARELAGLFLLDEMLIIHSAHEFATASEAFRRLCFFVENNAELSKRVKRIHRSHGQEGIELHSGSRIQFRTRTAGGGRGFTADLVIFDEAMILSEAMQGAVIPTLSSIENPQVWYTGSAVNEDVHKEGKVFTRVRNRGLAGDPNLLYAEWSADAEAHEAAEKAGDLEAFMANQENWADANPSLGLRISHEYVERELIILTPTNAKVERLGIGQWPDVSADGGRLVNHDDWKECGDPAAEISGALTFAIDVAPGFGSASIAVAGRGAADEGMVYEIVESDEGSAWLVPRVIELHQKHQGAQFVYDPRSPVISMIGDLERAYVPLIRVTAEQFTAACGQYFDAHKRHTVRYVAPQPEVDNAISAAAIREVGDTWVLSRKKSDADISPLVSAVLALWGAHNAKKPTVWSLSDIARQIQAEKDTGEKALPSTDGAESATRQAAVNPVTGRPLPTVQRTSIR
jgi:hypothetical protein